MLNFCPLSSWFDHDLAWSWTSTRTVLKSVLISSPSLIRLSQFHANMSPVLQRERPQIHKFLNCLLNVKLKTLLEREDYEDDLFVPRLSISEPLYQRTSWVFAATGWWTCLANRLAGGRAIGKQSHWNICKYLSFAGPVTAHGEARSVLPYLVKISIPPAPINNSQLSQHIGHSWMTFSSSIGTFSVEILNCRICIIGGDEALCILK